jgi:hypothetical protein
MILDLIPRKRDQSADSASEAIPEGRGLRPIAIEPNAGGQLNPTCKLVATSGFLRCPTAGGQHAPAQTRAFNIGFDPRLPTARVFA